MTALSGYLKQCRSVHRKAATTESSYYSVLETLFNALTAPEVTSHSELSSGSDKPDLGLYESDAPVLFVEVKLPNVPADELLELDQACRYAKALGGWVLATNLNDFVLGRLEGGRLEEQGRVRLFDDDVFSPQQPKSTPRAGQKLRDILTLGCAQRLTIRDPSQVASLLAAHARALAGVLPQESLGTIKKGFKDWLGADLDDEFLVSTTVQAVVYGAFASWLESDSPEDFQWQVTRDALDVGIIAEIVYSALSPAVTSVPQVKGLLEGVAGVLRRVDRDSLAEQFDSRAIEYFYEPFLAAYDPKLRDKLGVWYTPPEIAAYQVARADHHLREDLGISEGLADDSVIVLDPAAGTGTYLAAVYEHLFSAFQAQGNSASEAAQLLREAARTRLVGFEILPAALLIGDLHLRRLLRNRGVPLSRGERPAVYLTNSLSGWFDKDDPDQITLPWAAAKDEMTAANRYKRDERVLVVLGNPPYEGYSSARTEDEKRLVSPWISPLNSEWGVVKHRLNDLYVRFWAAASLRIAQFTGTGVVSLITNRSWLTGRSYPAMRADLLAVFDRIAVDDLGGHSRGEGGGPQDESVFRTVTAAGQRVGIAITTAVRLPADAHQDDPFRTAVTRRRLAGSAASKREQLSGFRGQAIDRGMVVWSASREKRWKLSGSAGADDWPGLEEYFEYKVSGVQPVRDVALTDYDREALGRRMDDYFDPDVSWSDLVQKHPGFAVERKRYDGPATRRKLLGRNREIGTHGHDPKRLVRCLWKPLAGRWLYWEPDCKLLNEARRELIQYWDIPSQICLVSSATRRRPGAARPLASTAVPLFHAMDPDARALPLWAPTDGTRDGELALAHDPASDSDMRPNIAQEWIRAARSVGVHGNDAEIAETVFYAICGVAASEAWLDSQPIEYDGLPTVPIPADADALAAAAETGKEYARLVDPWVEVDGVTRGVVREDLRMLAEADLPRGGDPILEYGSQGSLGGKLVEGGILWAGNEGWRNIDSEISQFSLGGFNTLGKHLAYFVRGRLTLAQRREVTAMARRIYGLLELSREANAHFAAAKLSALEAAGW